MEVVEPVDVPPALFAEPLDPFSFLVKYLVPGVAFPVGMVLSFFAYFIGRWCAGREAVCARQVASLFRPPTIVYPGLVVAAYGWVLNDIYVVVSAAAFFATAGGLDVGLAMLAYYYTTGRIIDRRKAKYMLALTLGYTLATTVAMPTIWPDNTETIRSFLVELYGEAYTFIDAATTNLLVRLTVITLLGATVTLETGYTLITLILTLKERRKKET